MNCFSWPSQISNNSGRIKELWCNCQGKKSSKGVYQGFSIYNLKPNHKNMNLFKMFMKLCSHLVCSIFLPSVAFILLHCVGFFHYQFLARGFWGFPHGASGKEPACQGIRDAGSILGLGRSLGGGHGNPPQSSCLENPID